MPKPYKLSGAQYGTQPTVSASMGVAVNWEKMTGAYTPAAATPTETKPAKQVAKKKKLAAQVAKEKKRPVKSTAKKRAAPKPSALKLSPGMRATRNYEIVAPDISAIVKDEGLYPSLGSVATAMKALLEGRHLAPMSDSARKRWIKRHHPDWFVKA